MKVRFNSVASLLLSLTLAACSSQSADQLRSQAEQLALQGDLTAMQVNTRLPITAWGRLATDSVAKNQVIHVYIEGDGHAWRSGGRPSVDPTPHNPVGLKLAVADPHSSVLYLARPCQFNMDVTRGCHFSVWTDKRFGEIADIKTALQQLIAANDAEQSELVLIGFSGGANLAVQLAVQLPQVTGIITVAGNMDADSFNRFHRLAQEQYGDNTQLLAQLSNMPQLHYTGTKDAIVPPALTRQQLAPIQSSHCMQVNEVANANHHGPWHINWSDFADLKMACDGLVKSE